MQVHTHRTGGGEEERRVELEIYFKKLAHSVVGAVKCEYCRGNQQVEISGKS